MRQEGVKEIDPLRVGVALAVAHMGDGDGEGGVRVEAEGGTANRKYDDADVEEDGQQLDRPVEVLIAGGQVADEVVAVVAHPLHSVADALLVAVHGVLLVVHDEVARVDKGEHDGGGVVVVLDDGGLHMVGLAGRREADWVQ